MTRRYFGTDGIRGRVGEAPITPELVLKLGWAAGLVLAADTARDGVRPAVLIGKDTRISGYLLEAALESGLSAAGVDVYLSGPAAHAGGRVPHASAAPFRRHRDQRIAQSFRRQRDQVLLGGGREAAGQHRAGDRKRDGAAARLRAVGAARQGAPDRGCRRPLHRILQEHVPVRARSQGLAHRRRLRARRRLPRGAAGIPRARRRRRSPLAPSRTG